MARPKSELTNFILSLPMDMPIKDVVAKVTEKGLTTTESNIQRVRGMAKKAASGARKRSAAKAAKKNSAPKKVAKPSALATTKTRADKSLSKSDFIRAQPPTANAAEVVATAKAAGIKLDPHLVYKVRSADATGTPKKASKKTSTKKAAAKKVSAKKVSAKKAASPRGARTKVAKAPAVQTTAPTKATAIPPGGRRSSPEELLQAVAAEVGLARAIEILEGVREEVLRIVRA